MNGDQMLSHIRWRAARLIVQHRFCFLGYLDEAFATVGDSQAVEKLLVRLGKSVVDIVS